VNSSICGIALNERSIRFFDRLKALYYNNPGSVPITQNYDQTTYRNIYKEGRALFYTGGISDAETLFRDVEIDYGIIPFAKFDEAQENYYTIPGGSVSCMAVPMTATNDEKIGAVTAALSRENYVEVIPNYYDIVLKVKGVRDEASIGMLDIIMDGRMVSTAFLYDAWKGYTYTVSDIMSGAQELASYTAANDSKVIAHFEEVLECFYK